MGAAASGSVGEVSDLAQLSLRLALPIAGLSRLAGSEVYWKRAAPPTLCVHSFGVRSAPYGHETS